MKRLILAGLAVASLSMAALTPAEASGGCGPYAHRGWNGFCRPGGQWGGGPRPVYFGGGYGWHRPGGPGWGWHQGWRWHRHW